MKHRNKLALFTLTALLMVPLTMLHAADNPEIWTAIKANEWYAAQPWLVGCNYLPGTAVNDVEMWQKETFDPKTIDRELGWAQDLGFNTVRVFLNYVVWEADADGLKKRFDQFLAIADKHDIRVMPILFDDCNFAGRTATTGKQPDPVPGVHNSQWVSSPPLKMISDNAIWPQLERYVKDIVSRFANDRRVVIWDLYNEPGNSGMGEKSRPLMEAAFAWARGIKPTQPLTTGAWVNFNAPLQQRMMELSDIISFHGYDDIKGIEAKLKICGGYGRPVLCTEWLLRQAGNNFESLLPLFRDRKIGCFNWGLVAGRTQTYFHWGSKPGSPEPVLWQHDILHQDGTPFNAQEVQFIRETLDCLKFSGNGKLRDINPSLSPLPSVKFEPLFDFPVRDTDVCPGPDQTYYLTGTTGHPTWWKTNEGIRVWKSKDLKTWEPLGLVWSFVKDATWQKPKGENQAIWAPELHYFKGTFWIAYCVNYGGTGILRSKTGKAEGPYEDMKPDGPLTANIDASLFADDNGKVYFVWQNGRIARLREDMTGLAEEPHLLKPANAKEVGFEGAFLTKINGRYHLICAAFNNHENHSTYDCMAASADSIFGPYGDAYLAIPHGGHNALFKDVQGNWWSTFFGNDPQAPFRERPAILPIRIDTNSKIQSID
jgi:hypothetical protein